MISGVLANNDACEQGKFNADCLFPTWQSEQNPDQAKDAIVQGVIGANHDGGFAMAYIPRMIDILLKFIAPIIVIMLIWSGIQFIIAGSNDDQLNKAKDFFTYAIIGVAFILLSYSILKLVYFLIARG
jgi:hypothetical protein